jgi:carbon-monoxide dehydrogenase large subunit
MHAVGSPIVRKEDARLLTGRGCYIADLQFEEMAHGAVVRSTHAHARILKVDIEEAAAMPGILLVLTATDPAIAKLGGIPWELRPPVPVDAEGSNDKRLDLALQRILARDVARYVGEPIAFVVGESLAAAQAAAEVVGVHYEALASVTAPDEAVADGAPILWPEFPNNVYFPFERGDRPAVDAAFAVASHVTEVELRNNRLAANPMEPRGCIGIFETDTNRYILHAATGKPHLLKRDISGAVLHIPADRIRVLTGDVGGGFGAKNHVYPEHVLTMLAAERTGRPVKWIATRSEMLVSDAHGRDQMVKAALALDDKGKFVGLKVSIVVNLGAYLSPRGVVPPIVGGRALQGAYAIPAVHLDVRAVLTNTTPVGTYRGAGGPEVMYILERLVDCAARELKLDPGEIRRRNLIPVAQIPFTNAFGSTYDSENFTECLDKAIELSGWDEFKERRRAAAKRGKLRGIGMAFVIEAHGLGVGEEATIEVQPDGRTKLLIGTMSNGQGHETTYAQIMATDLGLGIDDVDVIQGDTDIIPTGNGTGASRSITVGGAAVRLACRQVLANAKVIAARLLQARPESIDVIDGVFRAQGSAATATWADVAAAANDPQITPALEASGLKVRRRFDPANYTFPSGCHICEVEIDPATGQVAVVDYSMAHDSGTAINPEIVAGQLEGGVVQGLGQALCEEIVYDAEGQLLTGSLQDYAMPRAEDVPRLRMAMMEFPSSANPLGAKGAGESGTQGAPPAVINAIVDALSDYGVRHIDMPATAMRIWDTMQKTKSNSKSGKRHS